MNARDTVLDLLTATTGDREAAENLLALVEATAHSEGFTAGWNAKAEDHRIWGKVREIAKSPMHLLGNDPEPV